MSDFLVVPYYWASGNPVKNTQILDTFVKHPIWVAQESTEEERRILAAQILANPQNLVWEVWRGPEFSGVLLLQNVIPRVDALFHFLFVDGKLVGKRKLLRDFLGYCFRELGFERLTVQVPEFAGIYLDYLRLKMGFKYEGETRATIHPKLMEFAALKPNQRPPVWVASMGSRRERTHWHDGRWHDTIVLRLLRDEYNAMN